MSEKVLSKELVRLDAQRIKDYMEEEHGYDGHILCTDNIAKKKVQTWRGDAFVTVYFTFWRDERNHALAADFTSAGENVLSLVFASIPYEASDAEIRRVVDAFVAKIDRNLPRAYSMKLCRIFNPVAIVHHP